MIKPTVGRKLWYRPQTFEMTAGRHTQPFDATVLYVWSDTCVNALVHNERGDQLRKMSVTLAQDRPAQPGECEWMPYQVGQAKPPEAADPEFEKAGGTD